MPKSPILGAFARQRSPDAGDSESINLVVEAIETKDGRVPGFLFLASGLDLVGVAGSGPIRGAGVLQDLLYLVSGMQVFSLTPNGILTLCGVIGSQKTPVSMFANNRQLMIVDGVGGWLVPGGFPLTGGVIAPRTTSEDPSGGLYAIGDTITLKAATGSQSSYPILTVTGITAGRATGFTLPNAGTTYTTATGVPTAAIQPQPGTGNGFTIDVTATNGPITASALNAAGLGYAVNDTGTIAADSYDAVYQVTGIGGGGAVASYILLNPGVNYVTASALPTAAGQGVTGNLGTGLTFDITASAGPISASSIDAGGINYAVGNAGFLTGGSGDATYLINSVGQNGAVATFTITQPGAINDVTTKFTQQSTSGSGSGFQLTSPTFGAFVGLVPVSLPFPNPIMGGVSDGFGVLVFQGSQVLAASLSEDLSTWPALSFGLANQSPDNCIGLAVIHDEVFVQKQTNTEVWTDEGLANFPFGPIISVHIEEGSMAPFSVAVADEELIWLGRNSQGQGVFKAATAYQPRTISTQALTAELQTYPNLGDCQAYVRQEGGHVFYVATFPEANKTWQYDKTSSELVGYPIWTRLAAFENGQDNRHWGNAFTPWRGSVTVVVTPTSYQAESVTLTTPTELTAAPLVGLPPSFPCFVFSVWLAIPDSGENTGIIFGSDPGVQITIQNDAAGSPQITIECWDAAMASIVTATYDFATWAAWVNILASIDTATQTLQVWANTLVSNVLVETELTPASIAWVSSHPIAAPGDWTLEGIF